MVWFWVWFGEVWLGYTHRQEETDKKKNKHTKKHTNRHMQPNKQTSKQANTQTSKHTKPSQTKPNQTSPNQPPPPPAQPSGHEGSPGTTGNPSFPRDWRFQASPEAASLLRRVVGGGRTFVWKLVYCFFGFLHRKSKNQWFQLFGFWFGLVW